MSKKATIIAVVNQKGGTGKTTTTENLGVGLALEGKKVLLVDTDPQASLTVSLGNPCPDDLSPTLSDLMGKIMMENPITPDEGILHHPEGVDLVPSNIELSGMEVALVNAMSRETILQQYLDHNSGTMEITTQELPKSQCNNTDIKNTEFSDTDSIFPSGNGGMMDENDRYQEYFDYFSDQLSMDLLKKDYPYDSEMLDNILELIVETVCTKRPLIRIGAEERPAEIVRSRFMKLNAEHIRYVMDCFKENTTKIRNIRQYMLTTIYNAPTTIDTYYDALVRHDMSHGYLEGGFKKLKMKREEGE